MTTHLMVNGLIRCGDPPGHIALNDWPEDTRLTSHLDHADCVPCGALKREGGLQPGPMVQSMAEAAAEWMREHEGSPMDAVAWAIDHGVTVGELRDITHKAMSALTTEQRTAMLKAMQGASA